LFEPGIFLKGRPYSKLFFLQRIQAFRDALQGGLQGLELLLQPGAILLWGKSDTATKAKTSPAASHPQAATAEAAGAALPGAIACAASCARTCSGWAGSVSQWHAITSFQMSAMKIMNKT
jgi:hypothetical protein